MRGAGIGSARMPVTDVGGKELQEAELGVCAGLIDQGRQRGQRGGRKWECHGTSSLQLIKDIIKYMK